MAWGRLDDQANGNAKLLALSDPAWRMWAGGLIYSNANLTDGFLPEHVIHTFGVRTPNKKAVADELCRSLVPGKGPCWHRVEGGYQIHDYFDWNDSKAVILREREKSNERLKRWRNGRGNGVSNDVANGVANGAQNSLETPHETHSERVSTPTPTPTPTASTTPLSGKDTSPALRARFDRFWAVYPRKVAKDAAEREWNKLAPGDDLTDSMIAAVNAQQASEQWCKDGGQFIPHPRTWLQQGRWKDVVSPTNGSRPQPRPHRIAGSTLQDAMDDKYAGITHGLDRDE